MPNGTYGGVRGRKTKVGRKLLRFPPTRLKYNWRLLRRGHRYPEQVAFPRLPDVFVDKNIIPRVRTRGYSP
ncbi:MAG: hypothetical protein J6C92_04725, partial [Bacteroidaceae bacterium]|nr:hypothetical protein [Bacteroidaceae bacterium]